MDRSICTSACVASHPVAGAPGGLRVNDQEAACLVSSLVIGRDVSLGRVAIGRQVIGVDMSLVSYGRLSSGAIGGATASVIRLHRDGVCVLEVG